MTMIGQLIAFALFVWFTKAYVWPPLTQAMRERQQRIADGLAAGERGEKDLELAREKAADILREAREEAGGIIEQAHTRANQIVDDAKADAVSERERQLASARAEIEQELNRAREELRGQVAGLAVAGAERILSREMDQQAHRKLLDELAAEL